MELHEFIGIPFVSKGRILSGLDCWGLVWMVEKEIFGKTLPSYAETYDSAHKPWETEKEFLRHRASFIPTRLGEEQEGDILLFQDRGHISHVGVVVDTTERKMLHTRAATGSVLERYDGLRWKDRIAGVYRCG